MQHEILRSYRVWDRTTRLFHWINVLCVTGLVAAGLVILNAKALEVGTQGKVLLKTVHVYIGYVFCLNLLWRMVWGFAGNRYARWRAIVPIGGEYWRSLGEYLRGLRHGHVQTYLGHNPLARVMVAVLLMMMLIQAGTGLTLAGTDLYKGPFGNYFATWVAATGEGHPGPAGLQPGAMEHVDEVAYKAMRKFREPIEKTHLYSFYVLLTAIVLHIATVVVTEIRERNGLVSAMVTGNKVASGAPVDCDNAQQPG